MTDDRLPITLPHAARQIGQHITAVRRMIDSGLIEAIPDGGPRRDWKVLLAPDTTLATIQEDLFRSPPRIRSAEDGAAFWELRKAALIPFMQDNPQQVVDDVMAVVRSQGGPLHAKAMTTILKGPQPQFMRACADVSPAERNGGGYPLEAVARAIGVSDGVARKFIEYGILTEKDRNGRARRLEWTPELDLAELRRRFMTTVPTCGRKRALHIYPDLRQALGMNVLDPDPRPIIDVAIAYVDECGGTPSLTTLVNLLQGQGEQYYPILKEWWAERDPLHYVHQPHVRAPGVSAPEDVLPLVDEELRTLPRTPLDPVTGARIPSPPRNALRHVAATVHDQLRDAAFIVAFHAAAAGMSKGRRERALRFLSRHAGEFEGVDVHEPAAVGVVLNVLLVRIRSLPNGRRVETELLDGWLNAYDIIESYLSQSPSLRERYGRFQLALPDGDVRFFKEVARDTKQMLAEAQDEKNVRIAGFLDDPWRFLDIAEQRKERTIEWRRSARERARQAIEAGESFPVSFLHDETFVDLGSRDGKGAGETISQTLHCRIDTWRNVTRALADAGVKTTVSDTGHGNVTDREADLFENNFVLVWDHCSPRSIGGRTCLPMTVVFHEARLFHPEKRLTEEESRARARLMNDLGLDLSTMKPPTGMATYEGRRRKNVVMWYQQLTGRTLIPLEEAATGELLASFDLRARQDAPARAGEFGGLTINDGDWKKVRGPDGPLYIFSGWPKGWVEPGKFIFGEESYRRYHQVVENLLDRFRRGKGTLVSPSHDMSEKFRPNHYGLQNGRRALAVFDLNVLVKLLCAGLANFTRHWMRDLYNKTGREIGVPQKVRMERMHQVTTEANDVYGKDTAGEQIRKFADLRQRTAERIASGHPSTIGSAPVAQRPASLTDLDDLRYRLRQATTFADFFEAEGRTLPAITSREEARNLAARLAELESQDRSSLRPGGRGDAR